MLLSGVRFSFNLVIEILMVDRKTHSRHKRQLLSFNLVIEILMVDRWRFGRCKGDSRESFNLVIEILMVDRCQDALDAIRAIVQVSIS